MKKKEKVSFIVTVYNKERFLSRTVEAINNQKGDFDKEYIFIDDCSTDNSINVIKELVKKLKLENVIIHKMNKNSGVCQATRKGIELATGDYIKLIDADDVLYYDTTELLLKAIKDNNVVCSVCRHGRLELNRVVDRFYPENQLTNKVYTYTRPFKQVLGGSCLFLGNSMMLIKSEVLKECLNLLNTKERRQQDYRISLYITNKYNVALCDWVGIYEWDADSGKLSGYDLPTCFYHNAMAIRDFLSTTKVSQEELKASLDYTAKILRLGMKKYYKWKRLYQLVTLLNPKLKFKSKDLTIERIDTYIKEYKKIIIKN